jgi:hypothetical protein
METKTLIIVLLAANLPNYVLLVWVVFGGWSSFIEALWHSLNAAGSISPVEEGWEDRFWASMKLLSFVVSAAAVIGAEYWLVTQFLFR